MTQVQGTSTDGISPHAMLKLGGPRSQADLGTADAPLNGITAVYAISAEEALEVLCRNLERLSAMSAEASTNPDSSTSTPPGIQTPAGEDAAMPTVWIHCDGPERSAGRAREEAFQLAMLSRKFLSKKVPPIPLKEYIQRLQRYCPMAPAIFLATSVYITRMAVAEKTLRVTPKNMHRLVLAGLLVATKALEDMSYPHSRVAKVGGVSEQELSKLEITFCFMANFELRVDALMLMEEVEFHSQPATEKLQS